MSPHSVYSLHCEWKDVKMACLSHRDYRVIFYYNFTRGLSYQECHEELSDTFGKDCPSISTVFRWYKEFEKGNFNLDDDERTGRPVTSRTQENIDAVKKLIIADRRITYRQIQEILGIGASTLNSILHEDLKVKKLCSLFIPHSLSESQRSARVNWCKKMLDKYDSGDSKLVDSIVTGDETWLYYFDIPSKSQSKLWVFENEPTPTMVKQQKSVKKRMIVVFFAKRGIIKRVVLDSQKTVTAAWYTGICLPQVTEELKKIRPKSGLSAWHFHHDNAPAHRANLTQDFLAQSGLTLLDHPPYSPDLAPCDFGLFPLIKNQLKGRKFTSEEELLNAWDKACASVTKDQWQQIFSNWFVRMQKCINSHGMYFEKSQ